MERIQLLRAADAPGFNRVIDHARRLERIKRRCKDARCRLHRAKLRRKLRLTHNQAVDVHFHRAPRHCRLVAADNDGILAGKQQIFVLLRQRNRHLTAHAVDQIPRLVDDFAVEDIEQIENRQILGVGVCNRLHVVFRNFRRREHAVERAVVVRDWNGRDAAVRLQCLPCPADRHRARERGRRVVVQILHLCAHGLDADRRLKAEAV